MTIGLRYIIVTLIIYKVMDLLRQYVGGPKNRYKENNFNLDLTYITPRLIAMAFPASGIEKLYRNSIDEVKSLLKQNHRNHYMIMNLSGRDVDESKLNNVITYEWEDHQAPPIELVFTACEHASDYLQANENNVVVVHCNHGKGRTGTIVCCLLLYCNIVKDSEIAMDFYAKKRFQTEEGYGVTQPCQVLYIKYFQKILRNPKLRPRIVSITKVIFRGQSKFDILYIKVKKFDGKNILTTKKSQSKTIYQKKKNQSNAQELILTVFEEIYFEGDIKIFLKTPGSINANNMGNYSFNTAFLQENKHIINFLDLSPYSLRKSNNFGKDFQIELQFKDMCGCPPDIQYAKKCNRCRQRLMEQEQKWKKIADVVERRQKTAQRQRQSMLGFHLRNNIKQNNIQCYQSFYQIEMQKKEGGQFQSTNASEDKSELKSEYQSKIQNKIQKLQS